MDFPLTKHFDDRYTDKNSVHSYLPTYEAILKEIGKNKKSIKLLEIGVRDGYSIIGWLKALPFSKIYGIDCQKIVDISHPQYTELIFNAYDEDNLSKFPKDLDLFIEDGSHAYSDLLFAIQHFPKFINDDGFFVIEDIPDVSWIEKLVKKLPPGYMASVADLRKQKGRWDDVLLIIQKDKRTQISPIYQGLDVSQQVKNLQDLLAKSYEIKN